MSRITKNPVFRRFLYRLCAVTLLSPLFTYPAIWAFVHHRLIGVSAYVLAVLAALPFIGMIAVLGLYIAGLKDELVRSIFIRSLLWSMGATLLAISVWGFLELFVLVPHMQPLLILPVFGLFLCLSLYTVGRRYE